MKIPGYGPAPASGHLALKTTPTSGHLAPNITPGWGSYSNQYDTFGILGEYVYCMY